MKSKSPAFWKSRRFWFAGLDRDPCPSCGGHRHDEGCPAQAADQRKHALAMIPVLAFSVILGLFVDGVGSTLTGVAAGVAGCAIAAALIRRWLKT